MSVVIVPPLCECGCRRLTGWSCETSRRRGLQRGDPLRFCPGHTSRGTFRGECKAPSHPWVPVGRLQEAFKDSGVSAYTVALRIGWTGHGDCPDGNRVLRVLGLRPYCPGHGYPPKLRKWMTQATAVLLAGAMGFDPHEIEGL